LFGFAEFAGLGDRRGVVAAVVPAVHHRHCTMAWVHGADLLHALRTRHAMQGKDTAE
jgi:hypothetical protein